MTRDDAALIPVAAMSLYHTTAAGDLEGRGRITAP